MTIIGLLGLMLAVQMYSVYVLTDIRHNTERTAEYTEYLQNRAVEKTQSESRFR